MKSLMSQPMYNMFISALESLETNLEKKNYQGALLGIFPLIKKVAISDYEPFPSYKNVVEKLEIKKELDIFSQQLSKLYKGESKDTTTALQQLTKLRKYAHLLNFLENSYGSQEKENALKLKLLVNTAATLGVFFKEHHQLVDCHGNTSTGEIQSATIPTPPIPSEYPKIMNLLNQFDETRLQAFCHSLFKNLEPIVKDSKAMTELKANEGNMFIQGEIETVNTLCNTYKQEFKQLVKNRTNQSDTADDNDKAAPELCNAITSLLEARTIASYTQTTDDSDEDVKDKTDNNTQPQR